MKILNKIIVIVCLALTMPALVAQQWGGGAFAQTINYKDIDPLDTLDEEDIMRMRDTTQMSRINRADQTASINALKYVLRDRYTPLNHTFDRHWYDHIYLGASMGMEKIKPQSDHFSFHTLSQVNILVGKQLNKTNSFRLSLGGGWGYMKETENWIRRAQMKLDYFYNFSSAFSGYNPARRVEASLMVGIGANYTWMYGSNKVFAPEGHMGVQLKCYTGPLGTFNIEPYIGISSDKIDLSGARNWHGYDLFWGINMNYSFYLVDNLSKEARLQLLQSRMATDRMVDKSTVEKWKTPWFIEYSMGPVLSSSPFLETSKSLGNQTAISVGRWLSPVIGFRASVVSRSNKYLEQGEEQKSFSNSHYISARVEAMLNPFGFFRNFSWDKKWGAYILAGGEIGSLTRFNHLDQNNQNPKKLVALSEAYDLGAHFWYAISPDLQAFVEPRYSHNVYTIPYSNVNMRSKYSIDSYGLDFGITMLIRSATYRDPYELDDTQNYTYKLRGFRAGLGIGMPVLQRKDSYYSHTGTNWNALAYLEYAFNHLHAIRGQVELLTVNGGAPQGNSIANYKRQLAIGALNYEINLTSLCSGRLKKRVFELEAFGGFAAGTIPNTKIQYRGATYSAKEKTKMYGLDLGLKLSTHVWNGISLYLTPTVYALHSKKALPGLQTMSVADFHLYQTINFGVQYKIGKLRLNPEKVRQRHRENDRDWTNKQVSKEREDHQKRMDKLAKRKARILKKYR